MLVTDTTLFSFSKDKGYFQH